MARLSIKKVKFDYMPVKQLGYNGSYAIDNKDIVLNKVGRSIVADMVKWLKKDYAEYGDKIGTIRAEYYLEPHTIDLGKKTDKGILFDGSNIAGTNYEMILKIYVPMLGMGFNATEVHTYRLNVKHNEFEHENTELL